MKNFNFIQLFTRSTFILFMGVLIFYFNFSNEKIPSTELIPTYSTEINCIGPLDISISEVGVSISSNTSLGKTKIQQYDQSINIGNQKSIAKVVRVQPDNDSGLDASMVFNYNESMLNHINEQDLILYSSTDNGKTWQAHHDSKVDPMNNSIYLNDIEHFSLWTAGEAPAVYNSFEADTIPVLEEPLMKPLVEMKNVPPQIISMRHLTFQEKEIQLNKIINDQQNDQDLKSIAQVILENFQKLENIRTQKGEPNPDIKPTKN